MKRVKNNLWVWGYVPENIPGTVNFVSGETYCSLETALSYMGAGNAVFMNPAHDIGALNDDLLSHLNDCPAVVCGLTHGKYAESAKTVSEFSLRHKNLKGALIDDFRSVTGPSARMTVRELKDVYEALRSVNPELKLYLVRYETQDQKELIPYLDYFDAVSYWVWISSDYIWRSYPEIIHKIKFELPGKAVLQGVFLHDYGDTNAPMPMDLLKLQVSKISKLLRAGTLDGCVALQSGWFSDEAHMEQVEYLKRYFEWFYGTWTGK